VQDEVARDLEKEIAKKENSGGESELLAGDIQLSIHRQRGKSKVNAIDKSNDVESKKTRDKPEL
jgi:hypothetical protein